MNKITGNIVDIRSHGNLSIVHVKLDDDTVFSSIVIDTPDTLDYLQIGNKICLIFKETEVILTKDPVAKLSLQNKISGTIKSIHKGKLISKITIDSVCGIINAIINTKALEELDLHVRDSIIAMVNQNEVMISEL